MEDKIRLTEFTKGGGCGCKIPPAALKEILSGQLTSTEFGLLVGNSGGDDAAVISISDELCLVSTTDFFTPIVDDAYDFGRIAAANSISDIYAMGGKPILALSILAWPTDKLPNTLASEVIRGARAVCEEAGIAIGGGHSIENPEPIFGLAVNGIIEKNRIKTNSKAKVGDKLILTKPIGSGILSSAMKKGILEDALLSEFIEQLTKLNKIGRELSNFPSVHAMTDVTGFGIIGHLLEMVQTNNLTAHLTYAQIPLMNGVKELASKMIYPDNTMRNWKAFSESVDGISGESLLTLCDPQTNGGLLLAVDPSKLDEIHNMFHQENHFFAEIGHLSEFNNKSICIE
jgi:selenide,water dikinase